MSKPGVEWDARQLCGDGACIGVIGADGTCKVCGRSAPAGTSRPVVARTDDADEEDGDEYEDDEDEDEDDDDDEAAEANDDADDEANDDANDDPRAATGGDEDRALCPDGGCIGLIGADGRCKVCGKAAARPAKASESEIPVDESEPDRKLCPDGACVGVIGSSGTCNLCGKAATDS